MSFDSDGLPAQLLTAPVVHALTSVIKTSSGGTLCAASGGTAVQIAACDTSRSQQWTLGTDGTVHALGKCLDVAGGSTANGAAVELDTCSGGAGQKWQNGAAGSLVNTASGLCLADPSSSVTPGVQLIIWTCEGVADQNWTGTTAGTLPQREAVLPVGVDTVGLPAIASPGDVNSTAGSADGNPDLYTVTSTGKITEYPGAAPVSGTAQFGSPRVLGTLNKTTARWS